jgi:uncharacterized DUF497 family protein
VEFEWDDAKATSNLWKQRGRLLVTVFTERGHRRRIISSSRRAGRR